MSMRRLALALPIALALSLGVASNASAASPWTYTCAAHDPFGEKVDVDLGIDIHGVNAFKDKYKDREGYTVDCYKSDPPIILAP